MRIQGVLMCAAILPIAMTIAGCSTLGLKDDKPEEPKEVSYGDPFDDKTHFIPGLIEAEHFNEGKPGEAYVDVDEQNQGVDYRGKTQVDIEQRADASNGHGIGWVRAEEWVAYTVVVKNSGVFTIEFPVASEKQGGVFHVEMKGKDVTGPIRIPDTGGWTTLQTIRAENVRLDAGEQIMRLVMDANGDSGGIGDIDCIRFIQAK